MQDGAGKQSESETLIQSFDYPFGEAMVQLFDQKEQVFEIKSLGQANSGKLQLKLKWKHNMNLIKLDKLKQAQKQKRIELIKYKDLEEKWDREIQKIQKTLDEKSSIGTITDTKM